MVKVQGPYANRKECRKCIANVKGRCKTLISTTWIRGICPFLATPERMQKDEEKRKEKDGVLQASLYEVLE